MSRLLLLGTCLCWVTALHADEPFRIDVRESGSGWPVPLIQFQTTHGVRFVSDNAGVIAFYLPELMGQPTWFSVEGHGYEVPADGFGRRGIRLTPTPGGKQTVTIHRKLPAKRVGRLTGAGLFAEAQRFGLEIDQLESGIVGCDSVQIAEHNGKLYWAWGDTRLARYPLGLFHMTSATTPLSPLKEFKPPLRLSYDYFRDDANRVRNVAEMPGDGPTWLSGYVSLPDASGKHRLVAHYKKINPPLECYETGLCVWDESLERFEQLKMLWKQSSESTTPPLGPDGHPVFWSDDAGAEWLLFGDPFPRLKCPPRFEAWSDPANWQAIEPQETIPTVHQHQQLRPHRGSIAWNAYRNKWVTVFTQRFGKRSELGEIWYAEADRPTGPWRNAVKVVTHNKYTFYNPRLHPELTPSDSPVLLFEGTYTRAFSATKTATSRYDYNQILYRLDLDDPDLVHHNSR